MGHEFGQIACNILLLQLVRAYLGDQVGSPGADPLIKNSALVTSVDWLRKARPVGSGRT